MTIRGWKTGTKRCRSGGNGVFWGGGAGGGGESRGYLEGELGGVRGGEEAAGVADDDDGEGVGVYRVEDAGEEGGRHELVDDGP